MSIRGLEEILGKDTVADGKIPNVVGTGEAESSTAGIRKIIEEEGMRKLDNLADDLKVEDLEAENADAGGNVNNGAKPEETEQKTLSAGSEISDLGDPTDWAQAAEDIINTLT